VKKMARYVAKGMNTGFGEKTWTIMMDIGGGELKSSRPVRYYKTKKNAERAIKKLQRY